MYREKSDRSCTHSDDKIDPVGLAALLHEQLTHLNSCSEAHKPEPEASQANLRKCSCRQEGKHGESDNVQQLVVGITRNAQRRHRGENQNRE